MSHSVYGCERRQPASAISGGPAPLGWSARFYYEDAKAERPTEPTTVPIGLAGFANDFQSIRRFADRDHKKIAQWHTYNVGGHYAAHQVPEILAKDVREFFKSLR